MRRYRDRIGKHVVLGPWWLRLHVVYGHGMWAGSFYCNRKLLWLRAIDYEAVKKPPASNRHI